MYKRDKTGKFIQGSKSPTSFKEGHFVSDIMREKMSLAKKDKPLSDLQWKQIRQSAFNRIGKKRPLSFCLKISGENHPNWKGGISFEPYPLGWNRTFKEQIRRRDEYKCQNCGVPETELCERLTVHHKDTNKSNINPENLISLCRSCHTQLHWKLKGLML